MGGDVNVPPHWIKGQLLDLKRYTDGTYSARLLGDDDKADSMTFASSHEAQSFVSAWYTPAQQAR